MLAKSVRIENNKVICSTTGGELTTKIALPSGYIVNTNLTNGVLISTNGKDYANALFIPINSVNLEDLEQDSIVIGLGSSKITIKENIIKIDGDLCISGTTESKKFNFYVGDQVVDLEKHEHSPDLTPPNPLPTGTSVCN